MLAARFLEEHTALCDRAPEWSVQVCMPACGTAWSAVLCVMSGKTAKAGCTSVSFICEFGFGSSSTPLHLLSTVLWRLYENLQNLLVLACLDILDPCTSRPETQVAVHGCLPFGPTWQRQATLVKVSVKLESGWNPKASVPLTTCVSSANHCKRLASPRAQNPKPKLYILIFTPYILNPEP